MTTSITYTKIISTEAKIRKYWDILHSDTVLMFNKVSSDQVFGKRGCKNASVLRLLKQLQFFLSIIDEERYWDALNSDDGKDRGDAYYIQVNGILRIRRALLCKGFSASAISKLFEVFDLFNLVDPTPEEEKDGIGYMAIEGTTGFVFTVS